MPPTYAIPAAVMLAYAVLMIVAGFVAYSAAPEGANAATALIIPGAAATVMIICGVLTLMAGRNPRLGRIGAHAGVMFTIIFTLVFGYTAWSRTQKLQRFRDTEAEYRQFIAQPGAIDSPAQRSEFFAARDLPPHDFAYLVRTLWFLTALSGATFIILLILRPKPGSPTLNPPVET